MKYIMAALIGFIAGLVVMLVSKDPNIGLSSGVIVMCIFFCETAIMNRIDHLEGKKSRK